MPILPSEAPTPTPPQETHGNAWLSARASLAARRSAPFAKVWSISFGALTALALLVPLFASDPAAVDRAENGQLAADTLRSAQRLRDASSAAAAAESLHFAARSRIASASPAKPLAATAVATAAAAATPTRPPARATTPALTEFAALIERARRERTVPAWLAVSADPNLPMGPRLRGFVDSLRAYDARTGALPAGAAGDASRQELRARMDRAGRTIVAIAQSRLAELEAGAAGSVAAAMPSVQPVIAPEPSSVRSPAATVPDTTASRAAWRAAEQALSAARRAHDSLTALLTAQTASAVPRDRGPSLASVSPAIAMASLLLLGLLARFATALRLEMRTPTLADAGEAERLARAPVLTTVREAMLDGPARFHPSGIDPFRILYLGLTATGTRVRSAIVTGADPVIAAATGARLAIAAAADHRQTLVVDLDAVNIPLSRTFRERAEPGMSDALARAFTWREVARPVGSSDGLTITLLPAGTERDDLATGAALDELLESFVRLRSGYELTIIVAPPDRIALAARLVDTGPVILTVAVGETALADLEGEAGQVRAANHRLQGMVLWDAERPELPSRAELMAMLSKRKGRTPGGSFEAVQRAVNPDRSNTKKS